MRVGLPLMKNVLTSLTKSVLIPLVLTSASATDAATQRKIYESGMTTLIISNDVMKDIMEIINNLEESGLVKMVLAKKLKMKSNNKNVDFLVC